MKLVSFRAWVAFQASLTGLTMSAIYNRAIRSGHKGLNVVRRNKRVLLVPVPDGLAERIGGTVAGSWPPRAGKLALPRHKQRVCLCGRLCARGEVCERCRRIEDSLHNDHHRDPAVKAGQKYLELFTPYSCGGRVMSHRGQL